MGSDVYCMYCTVEVRRLEQKSALWRRLALHHNKVDLKRKTTMLNNHLNPLSSSPPPSHYPPPSLCGGFLKERRSLVAFTWTLTVILTLVAFIVSCVLMVHVNTRYARMYLYDGYSFYNNRYNNRWLEDMGNNDGQKEENNDKEGSGSDDRGDGNPGYWLASLSSKSMTFTAVYTLLLALGLALYGSTAIIGFTSLRGVYIQPCFSDAASSKLKLGMFGGAIVFFANLLLVCAVVLGEVRVEDWRDENGEEGNRNNEEEMYAVERIATILAVTCMFLSALYGIFAVLLFFYFGSDNDELSERDDGYEWKSASMSSNSGVVVGGGSEGGYIGGGVVGTNHLHQRVGVVGAASSAIANKNNSSTNMSPMEVDKFITLKDEN